METTRRQTRSSIVHVVVLVTGLYVFFAGETGFLAYLLFVFAFYDVVGFVTSAVHETAHAVTGLATGFRIREVSIGMGPRLCQVSMGAARIVLRLYPISGHTAYIPRGRATRGRAIVMAAAGPLSHLGLAWLAGRLLPHELSTWPIHPSIVIVFILAGGVYNLLPMRGHDGATIVMLLTMPDAAVAGFLKTGEAMDVALELQQAIEEERMSVGPQHRETFLTHLDDPTISERERALSLNNLAVIDLILEDPTLLEEADRASAEALELLPDLPEIRNTRGDVLIALGEDGDGIALMEPTMGALPGSQRGSSHAALALAYARTGNLFEARHHIAGARALSTGSTRLEQAELLTGPLEVEVARRYLDGREPQEAAALVQNDAGPLSSTIGRIILRHIVASGEDEDLRPMAEALLVS